MPKSDADWLDAARILQVDPAACPQVIEAAFTVLREMVLASDDDDAPRRLALLTRARRVLSARGGVPPS